MVSSPTPGADSVKPVAQLIRALLERHAIPRRKHASFVGEFFQLSRAAAHQRVTRSNAWTLEEIRALAERFGETLADVVSEPVENAGVDGTFCVGALRLPCRVWLEEELDGVPTDALVAARQDDGYVVIPSSAALGERCWRIAKLELGRTAAVVPSVAVYDAQPEVCLQVCAHLRIAGVEANAYRHLDDLLADAVRDLYDGYVIDWPAPGQPDVVPILTAVRGHTRRAALVLLTGGTRGGAADATEVAAAAARFGVQLVEKPVQPAFLLAALIAMGLKPSP